MSDDIGQRIRAAREKRGWSQEFLAAKVGATQSTIDRIESGLTRKSRVLPDVVAELELEIPGIERRVSYTAPVGAFTKVSYVLPKELIDRVEKYKLAIGVSSDDEAVRKIIDDFLKKRDDVIDVLNRILESYKNLKSIREAAGNILTNHPLVSRMSFEQGGDVDFVFDDSWYGRLDVRLRFWGKVSIKKQDGSNFRFFREYAPSWAAPEDITDDTSLSDQIPF